jgi:thiol-disulfide isomerase/thioredoxin
MKTRCFIGILSVLFCSISAAFSATRLDAADEATLTWSNGDSLNGTLVSADDQTLTWQSSLFVDPLKIRLPALSGVKFSASKEKRPSESTFRILLRNGDVLAGELVSISEETFGFEDAQFGRFELLRSQVLSFQGQKNSAGVVYSGPRGLDGWQPAFRREPNADQNRVRQQRIQQPGQAGEKADAAVPAKPSVWQESPDGSLTTTRPDAALFLPQKLPEKYELEVELYSKKMLSFTLALGRDAKDGLRLESWIDVLVAANGKKFTTLRQIPEKEHSLHLHLFVDQAAKMLTVYSQSGDKLGEVNTSGSRGGVEGITLRNGEWDLSLKRLRISHWDGNEPRIAAGQHSRIQLTDGTVHFGAIQTLNADNGRFAVKTDDELIDVALDQVSSVLVTAEADGEQPKRGSTQVSWADGGFVSGELVSLKDQTIVLTTSYSKEPLLCRLTDAISLNLPRAEAPANESDRLWHGDKSLQGSLVVEGDTTTPILWKPLGGVNASALNNGGDARFVRGENITHFSEHPEMLANFPDVIYLKNNDVLPCRIEACSDDTVQLSSPFSTVRQFERSLVRAVELSAQGRIHQKGFGAPGWKGLNSQAKDSTTLRFKGNTGYSHPEILTGDTVRFRLKWPIQSYSNMTVSLFGTGSRTDTDSTHVSFTLMQATLQVLDRLPQQNQPFFRGFGGQNSENIVRVATGEADIQIVVRDGNLLVSVDGKQVKTIKLNSAGAGSKGLAFNANVTMMGNVVINGRVQQSSKDGVEISNFEIDNLSGASVRQFIEEETRLAALTIPRFRRDSPPTHVLVAANGDLLRGRLLGISDTEVKFESRLEPLRVDRARVAAIVWLEPATKSVPEKTAPEKAGEKSDTDANADAASTTMPDAAMPSAPKPDTNGGDDSDGENAFVMGDDDDSTMQARLADGFNITLTPTKLSGGKIHGHSKLLGDCTFPAATIRELLLGDSASRMNETAYENWVMKNAQEPDWDVASADGGSSAGAEMIGKVAEDFELPLLDGTKFRLSEHADKVIVLDFWATWCGPCVAALPDYIASTAEFEASKVIFVAVNQQEASDQIRGFLSERNLSPIVALDRAGEIGKKFFVSGIPHTVILGPGNVVEDVHVGYQQGAGESMQIAIQQILDGTWKRPVPE